MGPVKKKGGFVYGLAPVRLGGRLPGLQRHFFGFPVDHRPPFSLIFACASRSERVYICVCVGVSARGCACSCV